MTVCYVSLLNLAEEVADEYPERPFIVGPAGTISQQLFCECCRQLRATVRRCGFEAASVAVVSDEPQIVHAAVVSLSGLASRVALLSSNTPDELLSRQISVARPQLYVTSSAGLKVLRRAFPGIRVVAEIPGGRWRMSHCRYSYVAAARDAVLCTSETKGTEIIVFTSGTTGDPKAVVHTANSPPRVSPCACDLVRTPSSR